MSRRYGSTQIKVLWILCLVHQSTQIKVYFKVKTQEHRRFAGCLTIVIQIRKWRWIACFVMVTLWRLFAMQNNASHPLRLKPYWQKNIKHSVHLSIFDIFVSGILCCVYLCAQKSWLTLMNYYVTWLGWLIVTSLAHCDVTKKLCHA